MKKRKNGEGSYGEKTIKGVVYKYYCAPDKAWTVYAKTAAELERKKKARETKQNIPAQVGTKVLTVSDLCQLWLLSRRNEISEGTYDNYEDILTAMVNKFKDYDIGNKQVNSLTVTMLESYLSALSQRYAKNSIDRAWTLIKQAMDYGQENELVHINFSLKSVKKPTERTVAVKKKEVHFTTLPDMEILYQEAKRVNAHGKPIYGNAAKIIVFIMYSGLRVSEAIGLKWRYVEKDLSQIRVMQSHRKVANRAEDGTPILVDGHKTYHRIQKSPKTESGQRTVPLPSRAREILQECSMMFPNHTDDDNVFLTSTGTVFMRENVERTLRKMLENSNCACKEYTPHSLRHGYGSILLSEGVDIKTVSVLLGHSDISITYNIYIHVLEKDKIQAVMNVFDKE